MLRSYLERSQVHRYISLRQAKEGIASVLDEVLTNYSEPLIPI